jgi:hypothetical protein
MRRSVELGLVSIGFVAALAVPTHTSAERPYPAEARSDPAGTEVSPHAMRRLGDIAVSKSLNTQPGPSDLPLATLALAAPKPPILSPNAITDPWNPKEIKASARYLDTFLIPLLKKHEDGIQLVIPTHVNAPNSIYKHALPSTFLVTAATGSPSCGTQLIVERNTNTVGQAIVAPTFFGRFSSIVDGITAAPEGNGQAHNEENAGEFFPVNNPEAGIAAAKRMYEYVCGFVAPKLGLH